LQGEISMVFSMNVPALPPSFQPDELVLSQQIFALLVCRVGVREGRTEGERKCGGQEREKERSARPIEGRVKSCATFGVFVHWEASCFPTHIYISKETTCTSN